MPRVTAHPPRVSVLTTVYNGARHLQAAIDSILGQEYADFELILVDDGSTDATPEILARAAARDPRIVLLRNETNRGIAASSNRGLALARCEYVARLDSDDLSLPGRLTKEVAVLDAHPDVAMVSMNYETFDDSGRILGRSRRDEPPEVVAYLLNFSNAVGGHSQVMFRRSAVLAAGGYDESFPLSLDYDLWTRLLPHGRIVILPDLGMRYRLHAASVTAQDRPLQVAMSMFVGRRVLSAYLGRALTDREATAVAHAWRPLAPAVDAPLGHAILREAYALFCEREGRDPRFRRRVRRAYARQLMTAAALNAKRDAANALRHAFESVRWHPAMALQRAAHIALSRIGRYR
jgi:glycosyltransferase involved in cell wall biosynthesis